MRKRLFDLYRKMKIRPESLTKKERWEISKNFGMSCLRLQAVTENLNDNETYSTKDVQEMLYWVLFGTEENEMKTKGNDQNVALWAGSLKGLHSHR